MPSPKALAAAGAVAVLAVAGCSSSKPSGAASTTPTSPAPTAPAATSPSSTAPTSGSSSTTAAATPGTTAAPLFTTGPVPSVTGATNLTKEPTVAAGTGSPPARLTGQDLVVGTGTAAGTGSTVKVQYVGTLWTDGKVFDASWTDQGPVSFQLSGVIAGFKDAIIGMKVGGRREIVIPPDLGYGASGQPPTIPPNATLVFVIDLLQVQ